MRKRDKNLLRKLHLQRNSCALISNACDGPIQYHHVLGGAYGREDHPSNLVPLCRGHHQQITNNDVEARIALGHYIRTQRRDVISYVCERLGAVSGDDWLRRRLFIDQ